MKKAYKVSCKNDYDGVEFVVFAETEGKAKNMALSYYNCHYTELRATREPSCDEWLKKDPNIKELNWDIKEHQIFLRCLGWRTIDNKEDYCCATCKKRFECIDECKVCSKKGTSNCVRELCDEFGYDDAGEICERYEEEKE